MSTDVGLESPHVYLFDTTIDATRFAVKALVDAGILAEYPEDYDQVDAALVDFQEELGASEYFHVVDTTKEPRHDAE